jgi:hypothetical protein
MVGTETTLDLFDLIGVEPHPLLCTVDVATFRLRDHQLRFGHPEAYLLGGETLATSGGEDLRVTFGAHSGSPKSVMVTVKCGTHPGS